MRRDIFQAIADPTRRAILSLIMLQAMTPNALAEEFDTTRQAVSKHIKVLQECGVLSSKQVGREIYYQAEARKLKEIADWIEPFRKVWEDRFDNLDKYLANIQKENKNAKRKK
ncbi:MAG: winged helix-turn-helix transcriptional regulator [Sphingobacteriia bacterium]|nr:winged helix-turn-helix transcriptional regulator [Sphingobacteriia bacterium]